MAEQPTDLVETGEAIQALQAAFASLDVVETSLPEFFMREHRNIQAQHAALDAEYALRKKSLEEDYQGFQAEIKAKERALFWFKGREFREAVDDALAEQPKSKKSKSVKFWGGKAGYRKTGTRVEVVNQKTATKWALENCLGALGVARTTPLKELFDAEGIIPDGCHVWPGEDKFYPALPKPRVFSKSLAKGLPGG